MPLLLSLLERMASSSSIFLRGVRTSKRRFGLSKPVATKRGSFSPRICSTSCRTSGVAVAVKEELNIPVRFVGVGEGIEDMHPFDPEDYARALLG